MKKPLKQSIQSHLNGKSLSTKQCIQLQQLLHSQPKHRKKRQLAKMASLASILVVLVIFSLINFKAMVPANIEQLIAEEVAVNHLKLKPMEIQTNQIQVIADYFTELEFLPIKPGFLNSSKHTILGGRYCSIQGETAAQLRIKDHKTGAVHSLYETRYSTQAFNGLPKIEQGGQPLTLYAKGLKVDVWVEKGVLFALAGPVAD